MLMKYKQWEFADTCCKGANAGSSGHLNYVVNKEELKCEWRKINNYITYISNC